MLLHSNQITNNIVIKRLISLCTTKVKIYTQYKREDTLWEALNQSVLNRR